MLPWWLGGLAGHLRHETGLVAASLSVSRSGNYFVKIVRILRLVLAAVDAAEPRAEPVSRYKVFICLQLR